MRRRNQRLSQMNVVPYIDVMLVLLIIFMITSPLLTQGIDVELPTVKQSKTISPEQTKLIVVSVNAQGELFLDDDDKHALAPSDLLNKVVAKLRITPQSEVLVKGDARLAYGEVVTVMGLLQEAGIDKVGLWTKPPQSLKRQERGK